MTVSINSISGVNEIGPNTQTVCDITEIQMLSSAQPAPTGSGPISYQWEIRPVATGNWGTIDGATSETLTPTVSGSSSAYKRKVTSNNSTNVKKVKVKPWNCERAWQCEAPGGGQSQGIPGCCSF